MTSKEGQPAGPDNQENYESTVLDFLDKEMAAVQPAKKKNQQSDELDALVSDLLKQVITEAEQPQDGNKLLLDEEDELFSGLTPAQRASGSLSTTPATETSPAKPADSPSAAQAEPKEPSLQPDKMPQTQAVRATPAPMFASGVKAGKKPPVMAVAFASAAVVIIGTAVYFLSGSSDKVPDTQGSRPAVTQGAKTGTQQTVSAPVQPAENAPAAQTRPAAPEKTAAAAKSDPAPLARAQTQSAPKPAAAPASNKSQPAGVQQNGRSSPSASARAKTGPERPIPVSTPPPPVEETTPAVVQASDPASATAVVSAVEPVADNSPAILEKTPIPPMPASPTAGDSLPATQPLSSAPPLSRTLIAAVPISQASPTYPELALRTRMSASIVLDLRIDEKGKVIKATPVNGPAVFHEAAVAAAMKWRYKPATIGGLAVPSQSRVTMVFNLKK